MKDFLFCNLEFHLFLLPKKKKKKRMQWKMLLMLQFIL